MYKIYLTKDILGSDKYRVYEKPLFLCKTRDQVYHTIRVYCMVQYKYNVPYFRKTMINSKKDTIDFGFHNLFFEIEKE